MNFRFTSLLVHVVLATRGRQARIDAKTAAGLYPFIQGVVRGADGRLLAGGGTRNHAHLLIRLDPHQSVAAMVQRIKSKSTQWVNTNERPSSRFAWQRAYAAFSVSQSRMQDVMTYIAEQPERHRDMSLEAEIRLLLEKHAVVIEPGEPMWGEAEEI